jgi:hypothetical protein
MRKSLATKSIGNTEYVLTLTTTAQTNKLLEDVLEELSTHTQQAISCYPLVLMGLCVLWKVPDLEACKDLMKARHTSSYFAISNPNNFVFLDSNSA